MKTPDKKHSTEPSKPNKKKTPSIKRSTPKKKQRKNGYHYWDTYTDLYTWRKTPVSERMIEKIANDLVKWAAADDIKSPRKKPLFIREFFSSRGIPTTTYEDWLKRSPSLKLAHREALYLLGTHRERGAILKDYDAGMIKWRQHDYDPAWKKDEEWRAKIKQEADSKTQKETIQWVMQKFPNSDLVPHKCVPPKEEKKGRK